jgi:hypothetical protein
MSAPKPQPPASTNVPKPAAAPEAAAPAAPTPQPSAPAKVIAPEAATSSASKQPQQSQQPQQPQQTMSQSVAASAGQPSGVPNPNASIREIEAQIQLASPKRSPKKRKPPNLVGERKFPNIRQQIIEIERYKRDFLTKKVALGDDQVLPSSMTIRNKKNAAPVLTAEQRVQRQKQQAKRKVDAEKQKREADAKQKQVQEANFKEWNKRKQKQKKDAKRAQPSTKETTDEKDKHHRIVEGMRLSQKVWAKERFELEARIVKAEEKYAIHNVRAIKKKHGRESPTQTQRVRTRPVPPAQAQTGRTRRRKGREHANLTAPADLQRTEDTPTDEQAPGVATAPNAAQSAGTRSDAGKKKVGQKKKKSQAGAQGQKHSEELHLKSVYRQAYQL